MRPHLKKLIMILLVIVLMTTTVFATTIYEKIEVVRNEVRFEINGDLVDIPNFLYEGTTYVPIRAAAEILGGEVTWEQETRTAGITTKSAGSGSGTSGDSSGNITQFQSFSTSAYEPIVTLEMLGVSKDDVDLVVIRENGELVSTSWALTSNEIKFYSVGASYGQNILKLSTKYTLDIYKKDGSKVTGTFTTKGLPNELEFESDYQVFYIPAMPEEGFNWPYYIVLPPNYMETYNNNLTSKNYLMVEGINNGYDSDYNSYKSKLTGLYLELSQGRAGGLYTAEHLMMPYLMPLIPRPSVSYNLEGDWNSLYTHALDRDTAIIDQLLDDKIVGENVRRDFIEGGFEPEDFRDLTGQVVNMINHSLIYLNQQDFDLEDKIMMYGYSAQGTFDDRFATLYPELIKAYASGATTDDLVLPLDTYEGDDLIFPIGISDYTEITGRTFNLELHNQVARLIFMGKEDTNDVTQFSDCYGDVERNLIYKHWGTDLLQRALGLTKLYGEVGGNGMFILDVGEGHGMSVEMNEFVIEFIKANRESDVPVYPIPSNPSQLEYTIFE